MEVFMFAENTDLIHVDSSKDNTVKMVTENLQVGISSWEEALEVTRHI